MIVGFLDSYIPEPVKPLDKPFLLPLEEVLGVADRSTVVSGRIESGLVKVGEEVEIVGIKETIKWTCTGVEVSGKML